MRRAHGNIGGAVPRGGSVVLMSRLCDYCPATIRTTHMCDAARRDGVTYMGYRGGVFETWREPRE